MPKGGRRRSHPVDFEWTPRRIPADGPLDATGYLVGEAGGENEHHKGRPFIGKAGDSLTTYLRAVGVPRPDLRINNVYPYWTGPGNPDPTADQIAEGSQLLLQDIRRVKPTVIGCLGRIATQFFLGPDVDMDQHHGVPSWSDKAPGALILPIYHPAAGFYEPARAALCQADVQLFAYYLQNPVVPEPMKRVPVVLAKPRRKYIGGHLDTEGLERQDMAVVRPDDGPWGYSWWSGDPDEPAEVVLYEEGWQPPEFIGDIEFHNALHDLPIMRAMGIDTRRIRPHDTMVRSYVLQLEPQSLKALVFRHCGIKMTDFSETVRPHFDRIALKWMMRAALQSYPKRKKIPVKDYSARSWSLYGPQDAGARLRGILTSYEKFAGTDKHVRLEKRWEDLDDPTKKVWVIDPRRDIEVELGSFDNRQQAESRMPTPFPTFSIFHVPPKQAVGYSGLDAVGTGLIRRPLHRLLKSRGRLLEVYETDRTALRFVDRMQTVGMGCDTDRLYQLKSDLEVLRHQARKRVQAVAANAWFNPGSADQVAAWLYSLNGLEPRSYTDGGRGGTNDEALSMLKGHNQDQPHIVEFIDSIQQYREADKYLGTYVGSIIRYMRKTPTGYRVFPNFRITRVVSGRLSSFEPNVLAFPTRTDLGRRIRECFVAREGHVLVAVDESQIELRMMADRSGDRIMMQSFVEGKDLHCITASVIFKIALDEVIRLKESTHKSKRYVAKTINFAVMYGITANALLDQLYAANIFDFTKQDCERFIREWFALFPSVRRFLESVWEMAEKTGYVEDMWGRRAYVPNIRLMDRQMKEAAQRLAGNMPIQGGGSGLVKRAQNRLEEYIVAEDAESWIMPWLQIHDELLVETPEDKRDQVIALIQEMMVADQGMLRVPLKAEAKFGQTWADCK